MKRIESKWWMGGALAVGAAMWMSPGIASAELVGPLVQCTAVAQPAALTTCADSQDPLTSGNVVLDNEGNLNISLQGGGAATSYTVIFRSIDGNTISLGTLSTGPGANGS